MGSPIWLEFRRGYGKPNATTFVGGRTRPKNSNIQGSELLSNKKYLKAPPRSIISTYMDVDLEDEVSFSWGDFQVPC